MVDEGRWISNVIFFQFCSSNVDVTSLMRWNRIIKMKNKSLYKLGGPRVLLNKFSSEKWIIYFIKDLPETK